MKTLYFSPQQIKPLNSGGRLRNYHLARELSARSSVTFVEMAIPGAESHSLSEDSCFSAIVTLYKEHTYSWPQILRGMVGPTPVTLLNCWSPAAALRLSQVLSCDRFDTAQIEGVHLMRYLPIIRNAPGRPAILVDWHNIESEVMWRYSDRIGNRFKKAAARRTAKLLERVENKLLDIFKVHTVASERERQKLLRRRPQANIEVIPNGVDLARYSPGEMFKASHDAVKKNGVPTILFVGLMDYHANVDAVVWFVRTAWPEIARSNPDLHFTIVGRDPTAEVRALASDRIHVTGTVDDVRPFYARALAAVVPLRSGSGTRLKILEAMAAGVPVVSTRLGAEGIECKKDIHIVLADSGRDISAAICRLAQSPETRAKISQQAREFVNHFYGWSAIGKRLCAIHEGLVESPNRTTTQGVL